MLPGRFPGFKNKEIRLLSLLETKMTVWREYKKTWDLNERAVSYNKFLQLWDEFYPDVVISKPMTDLCLMCQQNTTKLQRAANLSDEEKSDCVKAHQEHLDIAQSKRECYRNSGEECEIFLQTIECFHMTSRRPYWCPKTMKRRPCWCPKPVLWELNSFLMQTRFLFQ